MTPPDWTALYAAEVPPAMERFAVRRAGIVPLAAVGIVRR